MVGDRCPVFVDFDAIDKPVSVGLVIRIANACGFYELDLERENIARARLETTDRDYVSALQRRAISERREAGEVVTAREVAALRAAPGPEDSLGLALPFLRLLRGETEQLAIDARVRDETGADDRHLVRGQRAGDDAVVARHVLCAIAQVREVSGECVVGAAAHRIVFAKSRAIVARALVTAAAEVASRGLEANL
jgi:hypothetical protein